MKNIKKKITITSAVAVAIAALADVAAGKQHMKMTVERNTASLKPKVAGVNWEPYSEKKAAFLSALAGNERSEHRITSFDGTELYGQYFKNAAGGSEPKRVAICFHGYTSRGGENTSAAAEFFLEKGFDVLLPDNRAHGNSGGNYIGFGCLDRKDGLEWVKYVQKLNGDLDREGNLEIYLYGVSMGGATVCMMSGLDLPACVKGIISDCAFTSDNDMFKKALRSHYHLPAIPILFVSNALCKATAGYRFDEVSSAEAVKNAKVPMLFIHGANDPLIPVKMCYEIYNNCASRKELYLVKDAVHAESYYKNSEAYKAKIEEFFGI